MTKKLLNFSYGEGEKTFEKEIMIISYHRKVISLLQSNSLEWITCKKKTFTCFLLSFEVAVITIKPE